MGSTLREPALAATAAGTVPTRRLGRTAAIVSVIGMGGFHIGKLDLPASDAIALIHAGIDRGITFMDNSWDYNGGASELRMGQALNTGGYREKVFLMTKIDGRTKAAAAAQIDQSLARLLTDRIDLVQIHENIRADDADRVFAPGGAIEALVTGKKAGKLRFIGFTGHKSPAYHLHMLEVATKNGFTFDTVQMPLNVMDAHFNSFEKAVIPAAKKLDMGIIAMKTLRRSSYPRHRSRRPDHDAAVRNQLTDEHRRHGNRYARRARASRESCHDIRAAQRCASQRDSSQGRTTCRQWQDGVVQDDPRFRRDRAKSAVARSGSSVRNERHQRPSTRSIRRGFGNEHSSAERRSGRCAVAARRLAREARELSRFGESDVLDTAHEGLETREIGGRYVVV